MSDLDDSDVGEIGGEQTEVRWIVCCDHAATEPDGGRDHERVDRHGAIGTDAAEQMSGDPCRPRTGRDDLGDATGQDEIDGFVGAAASVQLDQDRSRNAYRRVASVSAAHRCAYPLMSDRICLRSRE